MLYILWARAHRFPNPPPIGMSKCVTGRGDDNDYFQWWKVYAVAGTVLVIALSQKTYSTEDEGELGGKRVVVVIPAFNEQETIAATVKSIALCKPAPYRIIVVDGQSTDNTVSEAKAAGAQA